MDYWKKKDICENLNVIDRISFHGNKLLPKYFTKYDNKRFTDYCDEVCKFSIYVVIMKLFVIVNVRCNFSMHNSQVA